MTKIAMRNVDEGDFLIFEIYDNMVVQRDRTGSYIIDQPDYETGVLYCMSAWEAVNELKRTWKIVNPMDVEF